MKIVRAHPMLRPFPSLCALAVLLAAPSFGQEAATAEWAPLPDIGPTDRMDPEVVQSIALYSAKIQEAEALGTDAKARTAVGNAFAELGLVYEANTMWTPARDCYRVAANTIAEPLSQRDPWLYRIGVCQHALGDVQGAKDTLAEVAPRLSGTAVVQAKLAIACFDLGLLDEAAAAWQKAIDAERIAWEKADPTLRPTAPIALAASRVGLAQVRLEQDDLTDAEDLLKQALALEPSYPHAHYLLGQVYAEQGREQEAQFELARGLNAFPVLPPDPHAGRLAAMRAGYGNRMRNIEIAMQNGQIPDAIASLSALLVDRPEDYLVLNLLARAYMMSGNLPKSVELLQRSETADPTQHQTKVELAIAYLNQANGTQDPAQRAEIVGLARAKSEQAIRIAPHLGSPYFYRGLAELSGIAPQDPNAGQGMQTAMAYFQQAHRLGCQDPQLLEQLAMLYAQMGRTPEMVSFAEKGAKTSPANPAAWMFLARAYLTVGRNEEALQACDRAITVSNNNPEVLDFSQRVRQSIEQAKQK